MPEGDGLNGLASHEEDQETGESQELEGGPVRNIGGIEDEDGRLDHSDAVEFRSPLEGTRTRVHAAIDGSVNEIFGKGAVDSRRAFGLEMLGQLMTEAFEVPDMGRLAVVGAYETKTKSDSLSDVDLGGEVLGDRLMVLNSWANNENERVLPAIAINELYQLFEGKAQDGEVGILNEYSSQYGVLKKADEVLAGVERRDMSYAFLDLEKDPGKAEQLRGGFRSFWKRHEHYNPCANVDFDLSGKFLNDFVELAMKCPRSFGERGDDVRLEEFNLSSSEDATAENLLKYSLMVLQVTQAAFKANNEYLYRCSHALTQAAAWLYWRYKEKKGEEFAEQKFVSFSAELLEGFSKKEKRKYLNSMLSLVVSDEYLVTADVIFRDLEELVKSDPDLSDYQELLDSLRIAFGVQSHVFVHLNPEAGKLPEDFHSLRDALRDLNKEIEPIVGRKAVVVSIGHGDGIVESVLAKDGEVKTIIGVDLNVGSENDFNELDDGLEVVARIREQMIVGGMIPVDEDEEDADDENNVVEEKEVKYVLKKENEGNVSLWRLGVKGMNNAEIQEKIFTKVRELIREKHPELEKVGFAPDMIIFNDSLHHIQGGKEKGARFNYLRQALEMLRKGGVLRIADPVHSIAIDRLSKLSVNPFDSSEHPLMSLEDFMNFVGYMKKRGGEMTSACVVPSAQAGKGDSYYRLFMTIKRGGEYRDNSDKDLPYTFETAPEGETIENFEDIFTIFPFNLLIAEKDRLERIVTVYMGENKWEGIEKKNFRKEFISAAIRYHMFRSSFAGDICEDFRKKGARVTGVMKNLRPGVIQKVLKEMNLGQLSLIDTFDPDEITDQIIANNGPYVSFLNRLMEIVGKDELMLKRNSLAGEARTVRNILEMEIQLEGETRARDLPIPFKRAEGWGQEG